ncbi:MULTISPECIES: DUF4238 domain-containing protein [Sphingomonadaceae]|uniref:DUF4238 domain-containing protein n=2 Tax=Sphingomonadaceae TaxID=41297 RepID=A0A7X4GKE7_9SPHN|nr:MULTISPECIES: DUF4238 domain-containing protein [Sphingomonadaceae]MCC4253819.1 DUF4238 domain-containing protein [Sphingobium naphthae]HJO65634.1 DUF4238 domain-containing protein [Sphingomonas sanguinis]ATP22011.1 hypothetical protein BV87_26565 [Sphingobium yanoikuyae]MDK8186576.1 DUF4238 domain-containing protein [Sphingomonas zeae]MDK8216329.1 DUF4238 domain-containing protein [Sphingomonas sp. UMB7805-LC452B]
MTCHRQRDRQTITTNPKNVGSSRYFYRVETFSERELEYLQALPNRSKSELARKVALNFIHFFTMTTQLRRLIASLPPRDEETRAKTEELLLNAERGLGEAWHVSVEHKGAPFLDRLRMGDASFWTDEREASDFCFFLGTQFTRTSRMSKAISAIELPAGLDLARLWPVESHLWATDVGAGFTGHRRTTHATILTNDTSTPFITADQPVINLRPQADPISIFYYPVTPTIALHLEIGQPDCQVKTRAVSQFEAERLNHDMYRWSEDQLYGIDGAYLEAVASLPKTEVL